MVLCPEDTTAYSITSLGETFQKPNVLPLLFDTAVNANDRTGAPYNLLREGYLRQYVDKLIQKGKVPPSPPANISLAGTAPDVARSKITEYITKAQIMTNDILDEYCFYNGRYRHAMKTLIQLIADATAGNMTNSTEITQYTQAAIALNQKLTDITQIVNAITVHFYQSSQSMDDTINNLNTQINAYSTKLREQAEILQSEAPAAELKKRMVEFTREKAMASNNLLSFYFFMDVVALGILFYVYKAS